VAPKAWSLIPPDDKERDISRPMWPTTSFWRPGFIYRHTAVRWHRIGVEQFSGSFTPHTGASLAPSRTDSAPSTVLMVEP